MQDRIGADKYHITQIVQSGGPVESYRGVDNAGTQVAVKVVHTGNAVLTARFEHDLESIAGLSHPNLVRVIEWGPEGDGFYVAREWVDGVDLGAVRRQGQMTPMRAAECARQTCEALSALHSRDVVHKDVRPENLIIEPRGTVKLIDVGIPRPGVGVADATVSPSAVHYISPEQARGQIPIPASDIYSLGATLYYLATGAVPFDAADAFAVVEAHTTAQPEPPRRVNPDVPAPLEAVITRAMAKDPARRYGSAEQMRQDLDRILAPPAPSEPKKHKAWPWVLGAGLAIAAIAAIVWWFSATVAIPSLRGMTPTQAQQALKNSGLRLGKTTYEQPVPAGVTAGTIMGQSPEGHTRARRLTAVGIVVAGSEQVDVPDLVGKTQSGATQAIKQARLRLGSIQQAFSAKTKGNVVRQQPAAGTRAPVSSPVTIVVSKGVQVGVVPDVVGSAESDAINALEGAGFKVRVSQGYSNSVQQGDVMSQSPGGDADADTGSTVAITVSLGRKLVAVPNVVGMSQTGAADWLGKVGLRVRAMYRTGGTPGRVVDQSPDVGTKMQPGSTVTITIGRTSPSPPPTSAP